MSNRMPDLARMTVEDLFRAKKERRKRLAKLPIEEKIAIVKKLQTVSAAMQSEKPIFTAFLKVFPEFADEAIEEWDFVDDWYRKRGLEPPAKPYDKRPDVIALTRSGKKIGIELKSWVNREQIAGARKEERTREEILKAIGKPQPSNETKHIGYVWLSAKQARLDWRDASEFRRELFSLVEQVDRDWPQKPPWDRDSDFRNDDGNDLAGFPVLSKYLHQVAFHARPTFEENWIHFPSRGGAYSPKDMLGTLSSSLRAHKNDERYKELKTKVGLDEVYLLIHYDFKAFAYNTPFDAANFGFKEAAEFAAQAVNGDGGYFDRIFLFHFLWSEEEAYRIL